MPEYQLDYSLDRDKFLALDEFTRGYIECAFWLGDEEDGIPDMGFHDLAPAAFVTMRAECALFQAMAKDDLEKAYDYAPSPYDAAHAGHDFWLTRNGHGAGFWDRGFGDLRTDTVGGRLSRDAKSFGACYLYLGDDGKVHIS